MEAPAGGQDSKSTQDTSWHVRRAVDGDRGSLEWIIGHFTPILRAQASYRLGSRLAGVSSVDDLVAQAWLQTLPKLATVSPREDRYTPVVLSYLATTVRRLANSTLQDDALLRVGRSGPPLSADTSMGGAVNTAPGRFRSAVSEVEKGETARLITEAIETLEAPAREILILRGVEGLSYAQIGEEIGETPNALAQRYHRALKGLRERLPRSLFDELDGE